jgi:hypothetical protein
MIEWGYLAPTSFLVVINKLTFTYYILEPTAQSGFLSYLELRGIEVRVYETPQYVHSLVI